MTQGTSDSATQQRINKALQRVDTTRCALVGSDTLKAMGTLMKEYFSGKPALIVADTNTHKAAGMAVAQHLISSGIPVMPPFIFDSNSLYAEIQYVEQLLSGMPANDVVPVAVGSGTINDITKLAAGKRGLPYIAVPTAASMDGYTAYGASISFKGAKQTFSCPAPLVVIADINIISAAPAVLNAAGYADLIAKIASGADWVIADAMNIEPVHPVAWDLTQTRLRDLISNPAGIKAGDRKAITLLTEGLIMTGLGMQASKTSRPASGAEHQFSHLWDNQHHTFRGAIPFHGYKVGIGSLASEALYGMLLSDDTNDDNWDEKKMVEQWPSFKEIEKKIHAHFHDPDLAGQAIEQSVAKYIEPAGLLLRLKHLKSIWPELKQALKKQLLGARIMQHMLTEAGAPVYPEDIGINRQRLKLSYESARYIRKRYTILDLVAEMNRWNNYIELLFMPGGFWYKK